MVFCAVLTLLALLGTPDAVHLLHEVTVTFEDSGIITENTRSVIIPLTGRGVQRFSSMSVSFRNGMEEVDVTDAVVSHWRGGRGTSSATVSTGPHSILSRTNRLESSLRETIIMMPGLEIGDTLSLEITRTIRSLPLSQVYSYSFSPVQDDSVALGVFRVVNNSNTQIMSTESADYLEFRNISPWPSHPLAAYDSPMVSIATGSPERFSAETSEALDLPEHAVCSRLDDIIETAGSNPNNLRMWVAENINYTGADTGIWPGWSPRSPEETLEDGSGVCRDRAILLTWLLRKAGYDAYPALVNTSGNTAGVVDARSFDHMFTVYRTIDSGDRWIPLDPTPRGIPADAGISFGLRGCTFLPVVPGGTGLQTIPLNGWNDSLQISLTGSLNPRENVITGTLVAESSGAPLELITTLFTRSDPSMTNEMFRRFFGAVSCDSVIFSENTATVRGQWKVCRSNRQLLFPGLREISLHGSRIASMLLPCPPDSFLIDAPATEILSVSIDMGEDSLSLPEPVTAPGYSCTMTMNGSTLEYTEYAAILNTNTSLLQTLLIRSGTSGRTAGLL